MEVNCDRKGLGEAKTIVDAHELFEELVEEGVDPRDLEPKNYEEEARCYQVIGERVKEALYDTTNKSINCLFQSKKYYYHSVQFQGIYLYLKYYK